MSWKTHVPYLIVILADFYLMPFFIRDTGSGMMMLLLIMPLICLITAAVHSLKTGEIIMFAILSGVLFVPEIFIFFNESAWVYAPAYAVIALIGGLIGKTLRK